MAEGAGTIWPAAAAGAGGGSAADLYRSLVRVAGAPSSRRELWAWCGLAVLSLALAGVTALLLAFSRIPGIQEVVAWPLDFFGKGLVVHVVFSFVVWFLAVFAALLQLATLRLSSGRPRFNALGQLAVMMTASACILLFVPALMDRGEPSLNNYVPVIIDPLYYTGVALLGAGMALMAARLLANLPGRTAPLEPLTLTMIAAAVIYLAALMCFGLALAALEGQPPSHAFNEELFWGGGHVLQFVNVALLMVGWYLLAGLATDRLPAGPRLMTAAAALLVFPAVAAPGLYLVWEPFTAPQTEAFTDLQYALIPPTVLVAAAVAVNRPAGPLPWHDPATHCVVWSLAVFALGGVLGLFVDGADTRTPAHYHGVLGGVNLVFMGLFFRLLLPLLRRPPRGRRVLYVQIALYGAGQALQCVGLFLAGGYGAPRKTAGAAQGLEDLGAIAGMTMNGIGALIAVIGGVLFIWTVAAALLRRPPVPA